MLFIGQGHKSTDHQSVLSASQYTWILQPALNLHPTSTTTQSIMLVSGKTASIFLFEGLKWVQSLTLKVKHTGHWPGEHQPPCPHLSHFLVWTLLLEGIKAWYFTGAVCIMFHCGFTSHWCRNTLVVMTLTFHSPLNSSFLSVKQDSYNPFCTVLYLSMEHTTPSSHLIFCLL